jgi:hypothetical protein
MLEVLVKFSQFGYHTTVAIWLIPVVGSAFWRNANATGMESDFYAVAALICTALLAFAMWSAYQSSGQTATVSTARQRASNPNDKEVISFENLSAWKWAYCLLIGIIAASSAIGHYQMNRSATGIIATFMLIYAAVDAVIAVVSFRQFWAIKSGQIVQLSNKAADKMFQH